MSILRQSSLVAALACTLALASCSGDTGPAGENGAAGANGVDGVDGTNGTNGTPGTNGTNGTAGINGINGTDGVDGVDGQDGLDGQDAPVQLVERCAECHRDIDGKHAIRDVVTVSEESLYAITGNDAVIRFNIKIDGVNDNRFTHLYRAYYWNRDTQGAGVRTAIDLAVVAVTIKNLFNGDYEATIPGYGDAVMATDFPVGTTFMLTIDTGNSNQAATVVVHRGAPNNFVVTNQSCVACHGDKVFREPEGAEAAEHHGASPKGVEACVVCHNRYDSAGPGLGVAATAADAPSTGGGTRLMGYVHGIHNSHAMPGGTVAMRWDPDRVSSSNNGALLEDWYDTASVPAGTYLRSVTGATNPATPGALPQISSTFAVGFPSYMNNCSVCHNTPAALTAANTAPPTWKLCMSCHQNWNGFGSSTVPAIHASVTAASATATTCTAACHTGDTVASFHNGEKTVRSGLIFDGDDQSVEQGKRIGMAITSITPIAGPPATLAITWTATLDTVAVDPCNTDITAGPVFFGATADAATGKVASNLSILRAYAQGNDWVNAGIGTSPGQPSSAANVTSTNTVCASNIATTTVNAETTAATLAIVSVQGKPQMRFTPGIGTTYEVIQVRSASPVREFVPTTGAVPTVARRNSVDIAKCNSCHEGSMYQHGGNRIDSIDLCEMCHNPAANEKNNRVGMQVDATESYDGKAGETYDLRVMTHAIHSSGESNKGLVYYRSNGIYFFGSKAALAEVSNWPTTGGVTCKNAEGLDVTYYEVAGSVANGTSDRVPFAKVDGTCDTSTGTLSTGGVYRIHNFVEYHYPRSLADCNACHVPGAVSAVPNPLDVVAVTVDAGAAPWNMLNDDVLMGATAASCMSCHQSGEAVEQFFLRSHAYGFGIEPGVFTDGRQTLLDAAAAGVSAIP